MAAEMIKGIKIGHATDLGGITGCTVILAEGGAVAGVDQRGGELIVGSYLNRKGSE